MVAEDVNTWIAGQLKSPPYIQAELHVPELLEMMLFAMYARFGDGPG